MTMWKGKTLNDDSRRSFPSRTRYTKATMREMFEGFIGAGRKNYGTILISYRDHAFPTQDEIKGMLAQGWDKVRVNAIDVEYGIVPYEAKRGGKFAKELLFVASGPKAMAAAASDGTVPEPNHTSFPVDIAFAKEETPSAQAINLGDAPAGDREFSFVLCHVGTNKNGDLFSREELQGRHQTAVNKKIDLKHSQDFRDIGGGVVASEFVDDDAGGHVECVGELYVADNENARLAYKLMKKGIIKQVSMECDYEEGECSVCGKRVKSKADYCLHLKKFKGAEFKGKPVCEVLHGITFTGLGLLDRKGADEKARITQVADALGIESDASHPKGGLEAMDKEKDKDEGADHDAAKKKAPEGGGSEPSNKDARIKELEGENQKLKAQLAELQKELEKLQAKEKAAANRARAEKLVKKLEKDGFAFGDEDEREKELERLAGLSDDAFAATEATYKRVPKPKAEAPDKKEDEEDKDKGKKPKPESKAEADGKLRTDAGVRPLVVDDAKLSLEDRLRRGIRAAYDDRVGAAV